MTVDRAIELLDVENVACFAPHRDEQHNLRTFCNSYTKLFVALAWNLKLPAATANGLHDWLADADNGWRQVEVEAANELAKMGVPLIASRQAQPHGHIAPVVGFENGRLLVSAAGARNFAKTTIGMSFGPGPIDFYTHD